MPRFLPIIIGLVLLSLAGGGGYILGQKLVPIQNAPAITSEVSSDYFSSQSATARGTLTKKDGNSITFKNTKGESQVFSLSDQATISKFDSNKKLSTPSADLTRLELNKEAIITLRKSGNSAYNIVAVSYMP